MLYRLSPDSDRRFRYAWKDLSFAGYQKQVCAGCGRTVAERIFSSDRHSLILEGGKEFPDFLAFTGAGKQLFLLSDQAMECLHENKITGFSVVEPVTVCDERGNPVPGAPAYQHLEITGYAELDFSAMQLKKKRFCPFCGQFDWNRQRIPALIPDEASWDGSDLCRIGSMPGFMICSDRFKSVVLNNGLMGFCFKRLGMSK